MKDGFKNVILTERIGEKRSRGKERATYLISLSGCYGRAETRRDSKELNVVCSYKEQEIVGSHDRPRSGGI